MKTVTLTVTVTVMDDREDREILDEVTEALTDAEIMAYVELEE